MHAARTDLRELGGSWSRARQDSDDIVHRCSHALLFLGLLVFPVVLCVVMQVMGTQLADIPHKDCVVDGVGEVISKDIFSRCAFCTTLTIYVCVCVLVCFLACLFVFLA